VRLYKQCRAIRLFNYWVEWFAVFILQPLLMILMAMAFWAVVSGRAVVVQTVCMS